MNWRRSEIISIGTMLVVAGWIWAAASKNAVIERTAQEVDDTSTGVRAMNDRLIKVEEAVIYLKRIAERNDRAR